LVRLCNQWASDTEGHNEAKDFPSTRDTSALMGQDDTERLLGDQQAIPRLGPSKIHKVSATWTNRSLKNFGEPSYRDALVKQEVQTEATFFPSHPVFSAHKA
jgi:hypothetical protein